MRRTLRHTMYRSASHRSANRVWLFRTLLVLALAALVVAGGSNWRARAQTNRFVAPFGDDVGGINDCTDPEAPCRTIQHAITVSGVGDLIVLASGTYFENVTVSQSVTIQGDGTVASTVNGSNTGTVFNVTSPVTAAINGLTITNGNANAATVNTGGGIYNLGTLTVVGCTLNGNNALPGGEGGGEGGGIFNIGTLTVINSTISGNTAGAGGGIFNVATATVVNSTISGNSVQPGGGVGGGIFNNVTGTLNLRNTIIAGSLGGGGDCVNNGAIATNVNNLVQDGSCSPAVSGNPNLGPLQDNGGTTLTHALLTGSPAIDAGDDSVLGDPFNLTTDQRGFGFPRQGGSHVDIGAFEFQPCIDTMPPAITCGPNQTATVPPGQSCVTVTYPPPTATDDCSVASVVCSPPSGSCFPLGTTTVTCTATDTSNNTATCSFTVTATVAFDICVQDDQTKAIFRINTGSGKWELENCSKKTKFSGISSVISSSCKLQIGGAAAKSTSNQASGAVNQCTNVADIAVTVVSGGGTTTFKLHDSNFRDSPCFCSQ